MKKGIKTLAMLSMLLAVCVACSANATTEAPENNAPVGQVAEPAELSEKEKEEITQEALYAIFEDVYSTEHGKHPGDWSVDFQITDEIGKVNKAIPEDVKAPDDVRAQYTEWRAARVETDSATVPAEATPEQSYTFDEVYEAVYATSQVNIRSGPGVDYGKVGSLGRGDGITRTGIGTGEYSKWSRVEFSDGTVAYVASSYLSTTKPVAQQPQAPASTQKQETPSSTSSGSSQTQSSTVSETTSETPAASTSTNNSGGTSTVTNDKYPTGTTVQFGNTTYTSTGELVLGGKWVRCTASDGSAIAVNIKSGTTRPLITGAGADVDLGDGGQAMADAGGVWHNSSEEEHNFNGES